MSTTFRAVQWNRHKFVYDGVLAAGIVMFLAVFFVLGAKPVPNDTSPPILLMRALGALGLTLLHIILAIGPLARLHAGFAPLLYNRRHLGVAFFGVVLAHAVLATLFYGGFGVVPAPVAVLDYPVSFRSLSDWPFEWFGATALVVFFLMASTSHDFWLAVLSPRWWKRLHMLVYVAYGLVVVHVATGAMQANSHWLLPMLVGLGLAMLTALHVAAGLVQQRRDRRAQRETIEGWVDAGPIDEIPDQRAVVVCAPGGPTIAVFRDGASVCAVANRCAHQGGPLGEGQIINGCITCPWHGYQFEPQTGASPPPYRDAVPVYAVRVVDGRVQVRSEEGPSVQDAQTPSQERSP